MAAPLKNTLVSGGRSYGKTLALALALALAEKCKTGLCRPHSRCWRCMTENPIR